METSRINAQYKRNDNIQLFVRDRMNSICPMKFFRTTDTTDTTDTTIWKPGFTAEIKQNYDLLPQHDVIALFSPYNTKRSALPKQE